MQYGLNALYGSKHVPEFNLMERPPAGGRHQQAVAACFSDYPRARDEGSMVLSTAAIGIDGSRRRRRDGCGVVRPCRSRGRDEARHRRRGV